MTEVLDDEARLSRFRQWLQETRHQAESIELSSSDSGRPEIGLYRLVEEFTALRQEVKLETKSSRSLQEQVESLVPTLRQAIDQFRAIGPREDQAVFAAARSLAESIADLDEALDRGQAEIEKARRKLAVEPVEALTAKLNALHEAHSWLRRWRLRSYHERVLALVRQEAETGPKLLDALLEGYGLIRKRLRRAMDSERIQRIESVGRPIDPERMSVVEVVDSAEVAPGHVVDEVRRGYTWRDRVLRFAEVRAARSVAPIPGTVEEDGFDGNDHRHRPGNDQ